MGYKDPPGIDLHIHSDASDGTQTPSEILTRASRLGLRAIAITDHDTIDGSKAALNLDIPASLKLLSGVEVSAAPPSGFPVTGSFHILGYGIRLDGPALIGTLKKLQIARKNRNPLIIIGVILWIATQEMTFMTLPAEIALGFMAQVQLLVVSPARIRKNGSKLKISSTIQAR